MGRDLYTFSRFGNYIACVDLTRENGLNSNKGLFVSTKINAHLVSIDWILNIFVNYE